jgi:mevalonate kinase
MEECELTLKDLQKIQESFDRILTAIFHQRIDYPISTSSESPKKRNDEDLDSKPAKTYPLKLKKIRRAAQKILTELGFLEAELSLLFVNDLHYVFPYRIAAGL